MLNRVRRFPWLHIADVVADEALARGFRHLGLTGTRWLVESEVYPERLRARGWSMRVRVPPNVTQSIASSWMNW